jgi:hypothetical protein
LIYSWRGRALARAGKEVMIKSVLQAISSYVIKIFGGEEEQIIKKFGG